jgi:glycosyltransferase involved in cell wall biosynthesis
MNRAYSDDPLQLNASGTTGVFSTISVCMATCNGERYLRQQLDTILPQLALDDELIIADDSSTDNTLALIRSYADPRIRLFTGNTFRNPTLNFEFALQQARGEIIVLADQDDLWLPNKLAVVRDCFARQAARPYLIALDAQVVDAAEQELFPSVQAKINAGPGLLKNLFDNRYIGCCLAFSRDLLVWALPFPATIPMHDMWLGQLCERVGITAFVPIVTMRYRRHEASQTEFRIRFHPWLQISRRWVLLRELYRRQWRGIR